jgi:hypothetical protein
VPLRYERPAVERHAGLVGLMTFNRSGWDNEDCDWDFDFSYNPFRR